MSAKKKSSAVVPRPLVEVLDTVRPFDRPHLVAVRLPDGTEIPIRRHATNQDALKQVLLIQAAFAWSAENAEKYADAFRTLIAWTLDSSAPSTISGEVAREMFGLESYAGSTPESDPSVDEKRAPR